MDVAVGGSPSRLNCQPMPLQSKWSISRHGCENARLISPASASTSPLGCSNGPRACDKAARKLLGQPRGSSVFPAPCRAALGARPTKRQARSIGRRRRRGLSQQAWGIAPKIKQVDDAITSDCQRWAFEVHPEVCFWALNQRRPMKHNKKEKGRDCRKDRPTASSISRNRKTSRKPTGSCRSGRSAGCHRCGLDCSTSESRRSRMCMLTGA